MRLPTRTLQVHWPEGNVLLSAGAVAPRAPQPDARLQHRRHGWTLVVKTLAVAGAADLAAVLLFVVAGPQLARRGQRRGRCATVAAPFVIGLAAGWLLSPTPATARWRSAPASHVWLATVVDRCAAALVRLGPRHGRRRSSSSPTLVLGLFMVGWRVVVSATSRPRRLVRSVPAAIGGGTLRRRNRHQPVRGQPALLDHF